MPRRFIIITTPDKNIPGAFFSENPIPEKVIFDLAGQKMTPF